MSFIFSILTVCGWWWGGGDKDEIDNPRTILVSVSYNRQPFVHIVNSCQEMGLLLNTRHCTGYKNIDAASPQEGPGWEHIPWSLLYIQTSSPWLSASGKWFLAPYQSASAIGESKKVAGAWGTGLVQAGAAFQNTCLTALRAYFAWEERAEVKWAPLEDACVQTCVFEGVYIHTYEHVCRCTWDVCCVLTGFCVCIYKICININPPGMHLVKY